MSEWYQNLRLSGELDQNNSPFILSPNGQIDFGQITEAHHLPAAPIRLSMGDMTNGYIHINRRHGKQIQKAGFDSIEAFVDYVVNNFTRIKEGASYENASGGKNNTYLIQLQDGHNNTLFVQLSRDGKYWNVNSAGVFGKKYGDKKEEIWSASEVQNDNSAVASDGLQSEPIADNGSTSNGTPSKQEETPQRISSGGKDTNNTDTKQGNEEKSAGGEKEPMSPTPAMIDRMIEEQRVDDVSELLISSELKKAAEGIAEAFGMKVVYLKKVFIKSDDPAVEDFEGNGFVRNGVIYLSLKEANIAQFTFGHELLHQLKQIDADSYMRIRQKVIAVMGRKAFEMEVKARQMTYANVPGYTLFEDYAEEVIADTLGDIITHTDMLPNIARSLKENPSLLDRFLKVVDNVRQYFRGKTGGALGDLVNDIRDTYEMTARQGAERDKFSLRLAEAKNNTDKNPSQAQKESGNYRKGHIRFGGYNYTIENPQGSYRSGVDENGKKWKQKMNNTYGYILGTKGKDGDHLDMFINDKADLDSWNGNVYVVDQVFPDGSFDEHKVMYGFGSEEDARKAYLSNYEQGWQGLGNITGVSKEDFDRWLEKSGRKTKAFSEYKNVKSESAESPKTGAFGTVYTQFRGKAQEAFDFLASHGSGDLLGVFHREGVGDIDAVWGDKGGGLDHIIRKHIGDGKSFHNIVEAANVIDDIIKTGSKAFENGDKIVFKKGSKLVTIRKNVRNKGKKIADKNWVLTAYDELSADGDVSAIAPVNQGQAARTTGKSQRKDTTKPSYSQKKNVKSNKKIPFSLKNDRTLAGVHNITEEKLLKAIKQGGLANPSVAVIDSSKQNHDDYGDISLILPSDKVAKRTGKNAGTWQGDAWTPTYPQVERQMSNKGAEKASNDVSSVPGDMYSEVRRGLDRWLDGGEENSAMAYMFLHEKGVAPEPKKIQPKFSDEAYNELKSITAGNFNIYGIGKADAQKVLDMYIDAKFDGDKDLYEEKTKAWLERNKSIVDAGANGGMRYAIAKENVELYDEYGFNYKGVQTFVRDVEYDHRKTGVDMNATLNEVEDYIKTNNLTDEFNTWMEGKEKEYGIKEVIFDGFTPSGNRRYVPNTLENVSKIMKKQGRNGSTGISVSFQNFAARLMPSYGTLKDIRSKKGLLTSDREKFDNFREKWSNVFFELGKKCQPDATGTFDDYGLARLSEAAMTSDPQAYLKKEYNVDFSDEDTKRLKEMVKAIKEESPAMYFETKFERPVHLDEFAAAVVPTTASNEVKQALQNAGVQIFEYDKEKEGDRSRAFNEAINSSDNIRFSLDKDKGTVVSPSKPSKAEAVLRDAVIDRLRENGMEVITDVAEGQKVLDEANGEDVMLSAKQKRALETATIADESTNNATVVSSADGAKVQNNLEILADYYEKRPNKTRGFITDLSRSLGLVQHEASQYGTFETRNGKLVTIRVSNHNARVSFFDKNGEEDGISIVISSHKNKGVLNDGKAHLVEYFYPKQSLERSESKPLADIVKCVSNALDSGKFDDTTGIAQPQEVNAKKLREQRVYHGSGADFEAFDHRHMGEGQGSQVFGWGTYVTSSKAIGESYAEFTRHTKEVEYTGDALTANEASLVGSLFISGMSSYHEVEEFLEKSANSDKPGAKRSANALALLRKTKPEEWKLPQQGKGQLYTVEIPEDNGSNYLDWENPLNDAQKEILKEGLMAAGVNVEFFKGFGFTLDSSFKYVYSASLPMMLRGVHVGEADNVKEKVSRFLSGLGFTGIKYPAGTIHGGAEKGDMNYVIFNEKDAKITDHVRFFRTANGEAYGFTVGGKIYVDPRIATSETPVHEYAHLWASALRSNNKEEWQNVVVLMKDSKVWDEVKGRYPELKSDDEIADEVIATYSGRRGAERLREEQRKIAEGDGGVFEKAEAISALERVKRALKMFWKGVADFLHIHYKSAEEVADRVMKDLLEGVDPRKMGDGADRQRYASLGVSRPLGDGKPKTLRGEEALTALDNIFNEPTGESLPRPLSTLESFKEVFNHPIRTFLGELVKVKEEVFNKIIRERRSKISGAILSTIEDADFAIHDTDGSTLYVKRYKSDNSGNTYNVVAVNKHGEVEDYVSSVHIKRDGNLRNKIKNGAELLLPQERDTDGTLFRNNSTPAAKVAKDFVNSKESEGKDRQRWASWSLSEQ